VPLFAKMMYVFPVKDDKQPMELVSTRVLLAAAGLAVMLYTDKSNGLVNYGASLLLFLASFFLKTLLWRLKINRWLILLTASLLVYFGTGSIYYATIPLAYGGLLLWLDKKPEVVVDEKEVILKRLFRDRAYPWSAFSNIIFKDGILTLDFTDNRLIQLEADTLADFPGETAFNEFCKKHITGEIK
jgi:hypothetical protein